MKKEYNLCLFSIILMLFGTQVVAQSSAGCYASAAIVSPVGLSSATFNGFTDVTAKLVNTKIERSTGTYEISVADFSIDAVAEDVYSITVPQEMALRNKNGSSCITAFVNSGSLVAGQLLPNGQKRFNLNSELILNDGHSGGKHSSLPFEVTVNFN